MCSSNLYSSMYFHIILYSLTFIRPILEYTDTVWQNIPGYLQVELEQIRIITGDIKFTSKELLYRETGLIPLSERRKQHRLIFCHKMVHKRAPDYLNELVPPMVSHTYFTWNNQNLQEIKCRTSSYQNSFLPKTVRDWNLLSAEIKNTESRVCFKSKISTKPCVLPPYYHAGSRPGSTPLPIAVK